MIVGVVVKLGSTAAGVVGRAELELWGRWLTKFLGSEYWLYTPRKAWLSHSPLWSLIGQRKLAIRPHTAPDGKRVSASRELRAYHTGDHREQIDSAPFHASKTRWGRGVRLQRVTPEHFRDPSAVP